MPGWINLAERAVKALERIADALEAATTPESADTNERQEERHAA